MDAHARLLAVEVLLADPQSLGNDALETDLYILRHRLRAGPDHAEDPRPLLADDDDSLRVHSCASSVFPASFK